MKCKISCNVYFVTSYLPRETGLNTWQIIFSGFVKFVGEHVFKFRFDDIKFFNDLVFFH